MTWEVTIEREGAAKPVCVRRVAVARLVPLSGCDGGGGLKVLLPPGLKHRHSHRVGQVQAALPRPAWAVAGCACSVEGTSVRTSVG